MKTLLRILILAVIACSMPATAQKAENVRAQMKESRKALNAKSSKEARKEAKRLQKEEGWQPLEGSLSLEKQLDERMVREGMLDEDFEPIYYFGEGSYSTDDKNAAYKFACQAARQDIASQLETSMAEAFDSDVRSSKFSSDESVTVSEAFAKGKAVVTAKLAGVKPIVKMYRRNKHQYEVQVVLIYSREKANELARKAAREELANKNPGLGKMVDEALAGMKSSKPASEE